MNPVVISLCDLTGEFIKPWAKKGYDCFIFDIQHTGDIIPFVSGGSIHKIPGRIEDNLGFISYLISTRDIKFSSAFPPCTELAVSGARHFEDKRSSNPLFQAEAMTLFMMCYNICNATGAPFFVENPVSVASSHFRKPDHSFHPWEYSGLLPEDDINPVSDLIPKRDIYTKKTCLWTGGGFRMPPKNIASKPDDLSPMFYKLGGKSLKTKNIRSATPRGFSMAVFKEHHK